MTHSRQFGLDVVASIVTGIILAHTVDLHHFMHFMIGSNANHEELYSEMERIRLYIIYKYPKLADLTAPNNLTTEEECDMFVNSLLLAGHDPYYELSPIG